MRISQDDESWRRILDYTCGDIDEGEEAVLASMQETLGIPDDIAQRYADTLQVKYAS